MLQKKYYDGYLWLAQRGAECTARGSNSDNFVTNIRLKEGSKRSCKRRRYGLDLNPNFEGNRCSQILGNMCEEFTWDFLPETTWHGLGILFEDGIWHMCHIARICYSFQTPNNVAK